MTRGRGGARQGSVISRQLLRVLSPRWALGDRGVDRNRGGAGGGRLPEGRDPSGHPRRAWSWRTTREPPPPAFGGHRWLPVGQCVRCTEASPPGAGECQPKNFPTAPTPYPLYSSRPPPVKILLGASVQSYPISKNTGLGPRVVMDSTPSLIPKPGELRTGCSKGKTGLLVNFT